MPYISSSNITVFPCANRGGSYNMYSRMTSEYNLTNIVNQLLDVDSFVITPSLSDQSEISFNIHGYYFTVSDYTNITSLEGLQSAKDIYACIVVNTETSQQSNLQYQELNVFNSSGTPGGINLDNSADSTFRGVFFNTSAIEGVGVYCLHILTQVDGEWQIPQESTVKFITNSNKVSVSIDDGVLS